MIGINLEIPGLKEITDWFQSLVSGGSAKPGGPPASDLVANLFGKSKEVPAGKNINGLKL
jgi:hypothetical protein